MANGIADVRKNRPFRVYVANFGRTPLLISKHITIGHAKQVHNSLEEPPSVLALIHGEETNFKEGAVRPEDTEEQTNVVPERFHGKLPDKLSELISTKDFREDPRNWEEILDENLKYLSDKSLKADILEMLRKH